MPDFSRFGLTVSLTMLTLALATVVVILRGDQVNLTPVSVAPGPSTTAVSTGASLRIRFARPMKLQSVEQRLTLDPPVAGSLDWSGSTLVFTPEAPLRPATDYTVTLAPGLEEVRGRTSREPYRWTFRTRAPAIVTLQRHNNVSNLWLVEPGNAAPRQLTREPVDVLDFSIAPDGNRIVYTRQETTQRTSLWLVDVQTGSTSRLSPDEEASFAAPAWSPRGDLIVYERRQALTGTIANPKLFAIGADGTSGGLVYGRGDEIGFGARWSPDGTRLAFFDSVKQAIIIFNFTRDLVVIPIQTTVTFDWSPDGRHLAIEDIITAGNAFQHVILVADAATGATTRLSQTPDVDDAGPAWSPDGRFIAFTRRATTGTIGGAQPWLVSPDGSQGRPLLPTAEPRFETTRLNWSPDSRQLLLSRLPLDQPHAGPQLWLTDLTPGSEPRLLGPGSTPAWLP